MLLACLHAGALAEDPKLLLLDELTTFLDVEDQFGVLEAVRAVTHTRRDVTAVWVTHRWVRSAHVSVIACLRRSYLLAPAVPQGWRQR
jgi:ABC-type cobalamin/Fe3+-siderophores transport system ATPase subunit